MYYSHFGLNQPPFKITPNTEFFFSGGNRGPILEALIYAITHGEGIIKVTGEVGSGKTMLCHMLPTRLPPHIEIVYIANPSVSPDEILHAIAFELQIPLERGAQRLEVMQALHEFLVKRFAEGKRVVVFVEESQSMPLATLEEIRLLSNLETRNDKLLQIVLFGQPELDENLRQPNIRQLRERITHSFRLEPFAEPEVREYLMFRMRAAGYRGPDLFSSSVVRGISRSSLGLTRRVNLIADKALLAAFSENTHTVKGKHVEAAVRDSEFSQTLPDRAAPARWWSSAALMAGGAALGIAIYALVQQAPPQPAATAQATPPESPAASAAPMSQPPVVTPVERASKVEAKSTASAPKAAPKAPAPAQPAVASKESRVTVATAGPAPAGSVPKPAAGGAMPQLEGNTLLESRLTATEQWLANEAHGTVSIQLLGTNDPEQLKEHLNVLSKVVEINRVFVYRTVARQKPSITVLYGSFTSTSAAREALDKLPPSLRANQPILRTVQGIRAEIKQHHSS